MSLSLNDKTYRKNIFRKISKIKKKELYFQIYQVILDNKETHNINTNGVFFDIYKINLNSLQTIDKILQVNDIITEEEYTPYNNYSESINEEESNDIFINQSQLPILHDSKI